MNFYSAMNINFHVVIVVGTHELWFHQQHLLSLFSLNNNRLLHFSGAFLPTTTLGLDFLGRVSGPDSIQHKRSLTSGLLHLSFVQVAEKAGRLTSDSRVSHTMD